MALLLWLFATQVIVDGSTVSALMNTHLDDLLEPNCTALFTPVGHQCLRFENDLTLDHAEAKYICEALGGHLAVFDTAHKLHDVVIYINSNYLNLEKSYWIDGERLSTNNWKFTSNEKTIPIGTPFWGTIKDHYGHWAQRPLNNTGDCLAILYDTSYYFNETTCDLEMHSPMCEQGPSGQSSCGGDYEGTEGTIVSPNFPGNYPGSSECVWKVTSPPNTTITVRIESFDTESGYDYLQIRDGNNSDAVEIVQLQGQLSIIDDVVSTGNALYFYFYSDNSGQRSGFELQWSTELPVVCPPLFTKFGFDCFAFVFNLETFNEAKVTCASMDGQLGKITTADQLRRLYLFIHESGIADDSFWIGADDIDQEGHFYYEDGTDVPQGTPFWGTTGENSEIQEPDGSQQENCVAMDAEGYHYLRDVPCSTQIKFICSPA